MRVLLAANASYAPPRGGATRSNLAWLEQLSRAGHECRIVAASLERDAAEQTRYGDILIEAVAEPGRRSEMLARRIREFQPDWVLVSSEDVGQVLLRQAIQCAPGRVVYLAHTPQFFGFGPQSWNPDPRGAELLADAAGVVVIGNHMAAYVERYAGLRPAVVHPPIYGSGPWRRCANFDRGLVTMINPSAIKGGPIFYELARRFPQYGFGALPGWATSAADRAELASLPNMAVLPGCRDIDDFLSQTRVLLMPSLWYEGFGLIVVEAMLRGVPVIASDSGGLVEATLGAGHVVPVRPIERYEAEFDEHAIPRAIVPPQDTEPWAKALSALLTGRAEYERQSEASRVAAERFVAGLRPEALEEYLRGLRPVVRGRLRILLAHNSTYYPAHGGGDRSNRLLMEALAERGHACRVVARTAAYGPAEQARFLSEISARGIRASHPAGEGVVAFSYHGVEVYTVTGHPNLRACFAGQIEEFRPDVILASTDDPAQVLLEPALRSGRPVIYLARATLALPFGPDCAFPSDEKTGRLRRAAAVVGVSEYVAAYIRRWSGIPAVHVPVSLLEAGPWPVLGSFDNEFVTMVNPCAVKGLAIFCGLADAMPDVLFAAAPTWGTNAGDLAELRRRPNIRLLDPVDDIDDLLRRTRVLLVPSLWAEARSRLIPEAMLRGVPVLAANVGGIPEAMLGVEYLLPVRPIERYQPRLDENMVPVAEVPPQDIRPWREALARLLTDREHYRELADRSRRAAQAYAAGLSVAPFESVLAQAATKLHTEAQPPPAPPRTASVLESLSPEKRALLALRLRKKAAASASSHPWFPKANSQAEWNLFCFPHAGGGVSAFSGWAEHLPVCPVRLPGRETRSGEPPFDRMPDLIQALAGAIQPLLARPFAFFGHSMGAAVAFELARELRRRGQPGPACLLVSAARAPQYRLGHVPGPDPSEAELVEELRRLGGVPPEVLENQDLMRLLMPALRADTALYRNYVYLPEPPLGCPIRAYRGAEDSNVTLEHLEAWRAQTTGGFSIRQFPGGHFYYRQHLPAFLETLAADVSEVVKS